MATNTILTGKKTFKDSASADTYNIGVDATKITIAGKMGNGDVINLEGLASEYSVKASGRTIKLVSDSQTVTFQLAANGSVSVRFLDGDLTAAYNGKLATLGTQKLGKKAVEVSDSAMGSRDSSSAFDGSGGAPVAPGSTFALTTAIDDLLVGTDKSDVFNGVVSATASKQTFDTGDQILDSSSKDADVVNITADNDISDIPTISGIEKVNFNLDALTAGDTTWTVDVDNITNGTAMHFDIVSSRTAVSSIYIDNDDGGERTFSSDFLIAESDTTKESTFNMLAVGTKGTNADLTLTGAAPNVTVSGAGYLNLDAALVTGLVDVMAAKDLMVESATAAAALFATSTGGDLTITDADTATLVNLRAAGAITATATALTAATNVTAIGGGDVSLKLTAATAATVGGAGDIAIEETASALLEVAVSTNGGDVALDLTNAGNKVNTITTSGSDDITVELDASNVDSLTNDKISIVKGNSGTLGVILSTAVGSADLSSAIYDSLEVAVDNNGETVTVASGQKVTVSADQMALTIAGKSATAATNTVTVNLDDGAKDANDIDLTSLTITDIGTVLINASIDKTASAQATSPTITTLVASASDVTINAGANALELATAVTLSDANTLTLLGSKDMTSSAADITAAAVNASAFTGAVTLTGLNASHLASITTGSAADSLTFGTAAGDLTAKTAGGNDTLDLGTLDFSANTLVIDMGAGTDTLKLGQGANLLVDDAEETSVSISGVENVEMTTTLSIQDSLISGQSWSLKAGATTAVTVGVAESTTSIDLSKLLVKTANVTHINGSTFTVDASGAAAGVTVLGAKIAKNDLSGSTEGANKLVGGDFDDTLTGGHAADTLTGGDGADTFELAASVGASATKYVTITDFEVNDGAPAAVDVLDFGTTGGSIATTLSGFTATGNILTKNNSTLADFVAAVEAAESTATDDAFVYLTGSDVYVYSVGADLTTTEDNVLVKLVGVGRFGIDAETAAATAGAITLTI